TTDTGEKPPSERFEKIGKRRSTRTHTPYRHRRARRVPFIKNRDPRYKRFFPGVKCAKCGKIGHYTHVCQDDTNGSKGKLEYLCAFGTSEKTLFTSLATINAPSQTTAISVSVLFDTGASTSVIDRKCVEELGITPKKASHTSAVLADGSTIQLLGHVTLSVTLPGMDGMSLEFEEECNIIEMKENTQHQLLL
ncbi:hypothetical protein ADUPG1_002827, partial [Aduncisulcus paluster]